MQEEYLIIITAGREDGGSAAITGASLAVNMQAMNRKVSMFLTMGGTRWAFDKTGEDVRLPGHLTLEHYLDSFLENGGEMLVCAPCVGAYCYLPTLDEEEIKRSLRKEAQYAGLTVVAEKLSRCHAMTF